MRKCGALMPVFALPSDYGIGGFSKEAYLFIDLLEKAGLKMWQLLPLGPTGFGDSPYQSFSTYAGNPYMIDLKTLVHDGLLTEEECNKADCGQSEERINYSKLYLSRFGLLRHAYMRFRSIRNQKIELEYKFQTFIKNNSDWLEDYCLYMAIKNEQQGKTWNQWPEDLRIRKDTALLEAKTRLSEEIDFMEFIQYEFFEQWNALHAYAKSKHIQLVGDIPFYVSMDSSDIWANQKLFRLTEDGKPLAVAGCPPDGFTPLGQLWGNPLYDWKQQKQTGYQWWIRRIVFQLQLYDVLRVDHFRGFDEYYSIPYGDETAEHGKWEKGPGLDLFQMLKLVHPDIPIIAEDLGFLTDSVKKLVADTGFPGMKILQFAFDSREQSDYLPYTYVKNCIVYTGTHDNNTIVGWFKQLDSQTKDYIKEYLGIDRNHEISDDEIYWEFDRLAISSVADYCVIPIQDFLGLDEKARINVPSTLGGNWSWKLTRQQMNDLDYNRIKRILELYGRL